MIGPLPETLQLKTVYAAALATKAAGSAAANSLMTTLFSSEMATVLSEKGIDRP
jgi:hypothetical protein